MVVHAIDRCIVNFEYCREKKTFHCKVMMVAFVSVLKRRYTNDLNIAHVLKILTAWRACCSGET